MLVVKKYVRNVVSSHGIVAMNAISMCGVVLILSCCVFLYKLTIRNFWKQ